MKKYLIILMMMFTTIIFSQNKSTVPYINSEITIDGELNESAWKKSASFSKFHNFYPNDEGQALDKVEVRMFHDGKNIYISATYFDTTKKNKISSLKRDAHLNSLILSDAFGLVIDPFNKESNGYYFTVNAGNTQLDALVEFDGLHFSINDSWNAIWKSEVNAEKLNKVYEIAIPFKSLNFDTKNTEWGIQFFYRNFKENNWITLADIPRNHLEYDLRFTQNAQIEKLPKNSNSKFTLVPSLTYNFQENIVNNTSTSNIKPSVDLQYNVTSSLRLDLTLNPDFSQIDVDQQVTNLTRFAVNFPEQRNFFLENSDLFNSLGTFGVTPFYSRLIGASSDMQFGLKLSGNVSSSTRIGVLNAQTEKNNESNATNYAVVVGRQKLTDNFSTTAYLVNTQETGKHQSSSSYNRLLGTNFNYVSNNNKWSAQTNYGKSFTSGISKTNNDFFNIGISYNSRKTKAKAMFRTIHKNFITRAGFTPRLYNYDPINNTTIRESYSESYATFKKRVYPKNSKTIDSYRYLMLQNNSFLDGKGAITQSSSSLGNTIWFKKNLSSIYARINYDYFNLKYAFDVLRNGNPILPGKYNAMYANVGYDNSSSNTNYYYRTEVTYGNYFNGNRFSTEFLLGYRLLPFAQLSTYYELNTIDLKELGKETFHLLKFTGEVFFSNKLNWTTYLQYNTQNDSFNVNSRLQWEYKPLSYVYFVITDNFDDNITRTNWGVSLKINYRFSF